METEALERLRAFRQVIYTTFGCRREALVEILDALLTSPVIEHPVHLSLAPGFQRTWGSIYDALNAGTMPLARLEQVVAAHPLETPTTWYAVDASLWPRNDAHTSAERGYYYHHKRPSHDESIIAGWNSSWLVQLPERCSSWTAPLRVRRMRPGENVNQVEALADSFAPLANAQQGSPVHPSPLMPAMIPYNWAWRWRERRWGFSCASAEKRTFSADPPPGPTGGRPRRHGTKFACVDPTTWPTPTAEWKTADAHYGWVRRKSRSGLHPIPHLHAKRGTRQARPLVRGTLIRLEVEHLPKPTKAPRPLWLWWWGPEPPDLATIWRVYVARFSSEHTFRFCKQVLKWTTPKFRSPEAADRWTWLVILAYVHLRLARPLVVEHRLPWQVPLPTEKLTPARVRRAFLHLLPLLGRMATAPKPCGRSPGRPKGRKSVPAPRFPVIKVTA